MKHTLINTFIFAVVITLFSFGNANAQLTLNTTALQNRPAQLYDPSLQKAKLTMKKTKVHKYVNDFIEKKVRALGIIKSSDIKPKTHRLSQLSTNHVKIKDNGKIQLKIKLTEFNEQNINTLESLGVEIDRVMPKYKRVQAWVPFDKLSQLESLSFVKTVRTPGYRVNNEGSEQTEGDAILQSDNVRSSLGYTGEGISIGVISDGADGIFDSVDSGDIPDGADTSCDPSGVFESDVTCYTFSASGIANGSEGTAMLEIVHDIAPDAKLYFTNVDTSDDFIDAVEYLAYTAGVDVIVDDLGFFDQPFFLDGDIAQTVADVVDAGVHYVSSAGNQAEEHTQELFTDNDGDDWHEFLTGNETYLYVIDAGVTFTMLLQWDDDDFESATNDIDMEVNFYEYSGGSCTATYVTTVVSNAGNIGIEPSEWIAGSTGATALCAYISLYYFDGDGSDINVELYSFVNGASLFEYNVTSDSIFGHPAVPGAIAVGAIDQADDGNDEVESFSSQGPVTNAGTLRDKPDVSSIDGVSVTGNGGFPSPFFGTSASAPHVAACLTLVLEANPNLTPAEAKALLEDTATDIETSGYDYLSGHGNVNCYDAVLEAESLFDEDDGTRIDDTGDDTGDDTEDDTDAEDDANESFSGDTGSSTNAASSGGCSLSQTSVNHGGFWMMMVLVLGLVVLRRKTVVDC